MTADPIQRYARWFAAAAAVSAAWALGRGSLATPPLSSLRELDRWLATTDGVSAALTVLRLLALVAGAYLLVVFTLAELGQIRGLAPLARLASRLGRIVGLGALTIATVPTIASATPATSDGPQPAEVPPTIVVVETADDSPADDPPPPVLVRLDEPVEIETQHLVVRGEHLWSIAADHLDDVWGRPPTNDEIADHWRNLIDTNTSRLVHPDEPDLIWPDQVFILPDPGPPPNPR